MSDPPVRIVVSGTDTEIGKTLVGAGLSRRLSDSGLRVKALKPVESGSSEVPPERSDGFILARAARQDEPTAAFVRLKDPVAPPVAADREGVPLDMAEWCRWVEARLDGVDVVLVEGAGGILSPLTWNESSRDLAAKLRASVLLVAPDRLGVLTHTLTAMEALRMADVPLSGVVFSAPPQADASTGRNAEALRRFAGVERVVSLPRVESFEEAASHLGPVAEWIRDVPGGRAT